MPKIKTEITLITVSGNKGRQLRGERWLGAAVEVIRS